ncbi:MAG: UDP-N-acetylmuramyl-tripeptide synthetase [Candidatus Roizmanbacteria bacterium GW2011_GWA2_34_18]|uniref:UDP-N-acetylmuramyl-tripeptide synthetase n=1 Tax=Candidatus Roizmanbacteria bacterium GW2011_GWA2_34_18 TaxID=1618477 RepID=A0A0G0DXM1_9BACT|nr:MAG: UDP-N-acetylmuramyl-tripeptide synthetase [Candidatus Roizmanbacteria bacterium GW2011_GWA2_34_18]
MFQKLKNVYHLFQAIIANIIYGFPSRKLKVIGITGTDGKTTTTHLIVHILKMAEKKVSFISSVFASIGGQEYDIGFHVTTPSPFALQKLLKQSTDNNDEYFVLETTSHALDQNRVWGIKYEIGIITNITHEHLDYHGTYENYAKTKLKLLKMAKVGIKNTDKIINIIKKIPNLTKFNQYNYSIAYTVCQKLGLSDEMILKAMKTFQLPKGRLDLVYDKDFKGLRDFTKRPLMGEASDKFSDIIILTEEDYRTEDPQLICQQITSRIKNKNYQIILNRQRAINKAMKTAKRNDVVVITGKGHENSLCRGKIEYPWNEYEAVKKALKI